MRTLVGDDNYVNRVQLKALLAEYGDCDGAATAEATMQLLRDAHAEGHPYMLITMDIELGDTDGRELVSQIRNWEEENGIFRGGHEAKILMVTVKHASADVFSSFHHGCEGYLVKPVNPEGLSEELSRIGLLR